MKHFIYTDKHVSTSRSGNATRKLALYTVKKNKAELVVSETYQFENPAQVALRLARSNNLLPKKTSCDMGLFVLRHMGIADFKEI